MLAKTEETPREPAPEKPAEPRRRTITLTNRAPISIVEDDWPVIAQGTGGFSHPGDLWGYKMSIFVRKEKEIADPLIRGYVHGGRYVVHAKYNCYGDEGDEQDWQTVRVGHVLERDDGCVNMPFHGQPASSKLWKCILDVGHELRERIENEGLRKKVTGIVDRCFAGLQAHQNH